MAKLSKPDFEPIDVRKAVAKDAGIGGRTVARYQYLKRHASPELLEQVQSGAMKIGTAHRIIETEKNLKLADKMYKFIVKTLPKCDVETNNNIREQLAGLHCQLQELFEKLEKPKDND